MRKNEYGKMFRDFGYDVLIVVLMTIFDESKKDTSLEK
jgi:hypothetical protein